MNCNRENTQEALVDGIIFNIINFKNNNVLRNEIQNKIKILLCNNCNNELIACCNNILTNRKSYFRHKQKIIKCLNGIRIGKNVLKLMKFQ